MQIQIEPPSAYRRSLDPARRRCPRHGHRRPARSPAATAKPTGSVESSNGNDHHLGQMDVQVRIPAGGINGAQVQVQAVLGLRDW